MVRARRSVDRFFQLRYSNLHQVKTMARQNFVGLVVSQGKMSKTVKVRVQAKGYDKRVHKEVLKRKDYLVHDEGDLCKEGDIVRIESIPKMTERKYFAIAEIKINKGQQFAKYQELAKKKVYAEEQKKRDELNDRRAVFEEDIKKIEDLKQLDSLTKAFSKVPEGERESYLKSIDEIKRRYNITLWPSTEQVVPLSLNNAARDLSTIDNRLANIHVILEKLMSSSFEGQRKEILEKMGKSTDLKPHTVKNILRKWVLDPRNDVPVSL